MCKVAYIEAIFFCEFRLYVRTCTRTRTHNYLYNYRYKYNLYVPVSYNKGKLMFC